MCGISNKKAIEIYNATKTTKLETIAKQMDISVSSVERYARKGKIYAETPDLKEKSKKPLAQTPKDKLLEKLAVKFSDTDLEMLLKTNNTSKALPTLKLNFEGKEVTFGVLSDTHIGSKYFRDSDLASALKEMEKEKCEFILHAGDVVEGMSGRPGQIYELKDIGYTAQVNHAVEAFGKTTIPIHYILGNHCFDMGTEVLTQRGFCHFDQLEDTDKVLSLDVDTNIGVWDNFTSKVDTFAERDLISVHGATMDMCTTEGHRVLNKSKSERDFKYTEMRDLKGTNIEVPTGCLSGNKGVNLSDDYIKLVAWLLTDGSVEQSSPRSISYTIWQSKDISHILSVLDACGIKYTVSTRTRGIKEICGKILKNPPLAENRIHLAAGSCGKLNELLREKYPLPSWLANISDAQFDIFQEELKLANGSVGSGLESTYTLHGKKEQLDSLQILYVTHGWRAKLAQDTRGAWLLRICKRTITSFDGYRNKKTLAGTKGARVWCLQVPMTNFMVRRNGICYFSGNCNWINTKSGVGMDLGEYIQGKTTNMHFLGYHEGTLTVNGAKFMLYHGEDGSSYATSYRVQKVIEMLSGGEKPNALFLGHTHKSIYLFERNIHAISAGCIERQSAFMRGKKLSAHTGFWICKATIANKEIKKLSATWYPIYE